MESNDKSLVTGTVGWAMTFAGTLAIVMGIVLAVPSLDIPKQFLWSSVLFYCVMIFLFLVYAKKKIRQPK